ncbi:hypothetical protein [Neorhizobium alkalisoli]|uniref:hypothetical protein n=1 Tax=Neorhizobium alkalisoli TaxID=528178 RepID=UPI000CF8B3C9|nr:hypothetical protein [Neorhizobium alkalisoli]
MGEYQLMAIAVLLAVIGGAIAARLAQVGIWKGIFVAVVASLAAIVAFFVPGFDRGLAMPLAGLIGAGVSGALLGLSAPTTANILIGTAVPPMLAFVIMEMGA